VEVVGNLLLLPTFLSILSMVLAEFLKVVHLGNRNGLDLGSGVCFVFAFPRCFLLGSCMASLTWHFPRVSVLYLS
jgi:hypothetical protein